MKFHEVYYDRTRHFQSRSLTRAHQSRFRLISTWIRPDRVSSRPSAPTICSSNTTILYINFKTKYTIRNRRNMDQQHYVPCYSLYPITSVFANWKTSSQKSSCSFENTMSKLAEFAREKRLTIKLNSFQKNLLSVLAANESG